MAAAIGKRQTSGCLPESSPWRLLVRQENVPGAAGAAVIIPPFGEEAKFWRRTIKILADAMAARGISWLTFDLSGCAESEGIGGIATWIEDVQFCTQELSRQIAGGTVSLVGIGTGAALATLASEQHAAIRQFWIDPELDLCSYFRNLIRRHALYHVIHGSQSHHKPDWLDIEGCALAGDFRDELDRFRKLLEQSVRRTVSRCVIIESGRRFSGRSQASWPQGVAADVLKLNLDFDSDKANHQLANTVSAKLVVACGSSAGPIPAAQAVAKPALRLLSDQTEYGQLVSFQGCGGEIRGALLRRPKAKWIAILLHGRGGYRIGPNRLLCELGKVLYSEGLSSLRFDFMGFGESDGGGIDAAVDLDEWLTSRLVDDVNSAVTFARQGDERIKIMLCGICMGAYVALRSLPVVRGRIDACCLLSPHISGVELQWGTRTRSVLSICGEYVRKACSGTTWRRLVQGKVSWGGVARVFRQRLFPSGLPVGEESVAPPAIDGRIPCLRIYGDHDPHRHGVEGVIERDFGSRLASEVVVLSRADHNFNSADARSRVLRKTGQFSSRLLTSVSGANG